MLYSLNENIKNLRIAHGMNQVEFANLVGVTKQCVSNWENDNIQPSIEMLLKISRTFNVSTDFLLGEDNHRYIEVTKLTKTQIHHVQQIINDIVGE